MIVSAIASGSVSLSKKPFQENTSAAHAKYNATAGWSSRIVPSRWPRSKTAIIRERRRSLASPDGTALIGVYRETRQLLRPSLSHVTVA